MMRTLLLLVISCTHAKTPKPQIEITTSKGTLRLELTPDHTPITVTNFLAYVDAAFFDGLTFHRVIKNFMAQGGGFDSNLNEKPALFPPIKLEAATSLSNTRGTIAMARTTDPDSATSEFFINHADNKFLDASKSSDGYAVFGYVIDGLSVLDSIATVATHSVTVHGTKFDDVPKTPVVIESVRRVVVAAPSPEPTAAPAPRPTPRPTIAPTPSVDETTRAPTALRIRSGYATTESDDAIMAPKAHGTCPTPVQASLRWGCDRDLADDICCFNRHYAEPAGYFSTTSWPDDVTEAPQDYYDPVSGKPLFRAPVGRSRADLLAESKKHGWPSFRDEEVYWDNVRVLANGKARRGTQISGSMAWRPTEASLDRSPLRRHRDISSLDFHTGETVSIDGTHLGHNLPDDAGNRYCINLVSVAGRSCDEWFGPGASSDDLLTTIVDLDVPDEFCSKYNLTAPCVYVHRSGPGSLCHLPGPPDVCHRYVRVTYDSCPVYIRGAGGIDVDDRFDATTGVLKACSNDVVKVETFYLGPPAADPRPCGPQLVGTDTAAAASQKLPETYVLALLAASAAVVIAFAACGRRSQKYAPPTEVEIPPLDPDEGYEDAALV